MAYLIVIVVLAGVVYLVSEPLRAERRRAATVAETGATEPSLADLEAARDAKYREIRDAELDLRTGKLSEEDHRAIDTALRAEAIEILNALERAQGSAARAGGSG